MTTASSEALSAYLEAQREPVEAALQRAVSARLLGATTEVMDAARHGVTGGGKRLRPILCVVAYEACGGRSVPAVYDLAASLELIHAYSLMHDDLPCMDDAELRRGRPTTHRALGEDATMLAGAALIPAAALQALAACTELGCSPGEAESVARALLEAAGAGAWWVASGSICWAKAGRSPPRRSTGCTAARRGRSWRLHW